MSARRRDESAQDVPIALTVVGSETLEKTGNYTLAQIQQIVPSLQVFSFNPRNTNINIRGLGSNVALFTPSAGLEVRIIGDFSRQKQNHDFPLIDTSNPWLSSILSSSASTDGTVSAMAP